MATDYTIDVLIEIPQGTVNNSATAGQGLNVMVQSFNGFQTGLTASFSQVSNAQPSPASRLHTSTTRMNNDRLTIDGWVRCARCGGNTVDFGDYAARFKRTMINEQYTIAELAKITTPIGTYQNMRLADITFTMDGELGQELQISSTWEAANISGEIGTSSTVIGGLGLPVFVEGGLIT